MKTLGKTERRKREDWAEGIDGQTQSKNKLVTWLFLVQFDATVRHGSDLKVKQRPKINYCMAKGGEIIACKYI